MHRSAHFVMAVLLCLAPLFAPVVQADSPATAENSDSAVAETTSVLIIENMGQFDANARFQVWGGSGTTWLAEDAVWISLLEPATEEDDASQELQLLSEQMPAETSHKGVNLRLSFEGANAHPQLEPFGPSETVVSYFYGDDPDKWLPDVPVWTGVRYVDLYPGVDLEISGEAGSWGWRMVARDEAAQAGLQDVRLRVEGAEQLSLENGSLRLQTVMGDVSIPLLQAVDSSNVPLALPADGLGLDGGSVSAPFVSAVEAVASTDAVSSLRYSTFLGGSLEDSGLAVAVDGSGRSYVTGYTSSTDYPTTIGDTTFAGQTDAYVTCFNSAGTKLVYCTFLGGTSADRGVDIAVDDAGRAFMTGHTYSPGRYPTTVGAFDTTYNGGQTDAFMTVLNATGSALVYSTYLGGKDIDFAYGIALDTEGNAYVTGDTTSGNYPTSAGAYDTSFNGTSDVFVTVLNQTGSALVYSTLVGKGDPDIGYAIAVDAKGRAYVTGCTDSTRFPTTEGAYGTVHNGETDAFVFLLNASGSALLYSTFLGGRSWDHAVGITVDRAGQAYITGDTGSTDYPNTTGAFDRTYNGGSVDAFVSVLNASGSGLVFSTFLGGASYDYGYDIALDAEGQLYVAGVTDSADYPASVGAFDTDPESSDAFLSVLSAAGSELVYGTFIGGANRDSGRSVAVDGAGQVYVIGGTASSDYPTTAGAFDTTYNGQVDIIVSVLLMLPAGAHFEPATEWWDGLKRWAPQNLSPRMTGDVDGDGDDDVVAFNATLGAHVALSTGNALLKPTQWTSEFAWPQGAYNWRTLGDVNGDGRDDIVGFKYGDGVYVALSTGSAFAASSEWLDAFGSFGPQITYPRLVGDVDGDSKADIVAIHPTKGVYVALSTGSAFAARAQWSATADWMSDARNWVTLGDVDGDGDADLVNFRYGEGVYVALSDGSSYGMRTLWWDGLKYWGPDNRYPRLVGDVTGDGKADIVAYGPNRGGFVGVSTGTAFQKPVQWTSEFAMKGNNYNLHALGDMNGDGREDALCFIYEDGVYVALASSE